VNGEVEWNGLNQALREAGVSAVARVRHETAVGFDFIPLPGSAPVELPAGTAELFGAESAYPVERQHRSALFDGPSDLVVLSLQPEVMNTRLMHRASGVSLLSEDVRGWDAARRQQLEAAWRKSGAIPLAQSMAALERLLDAIALELQAPVLIYNLCPILPGEKAHSYLGAADALALRIRRFNLALAELSTRRDFSIVDVERISAGAGAESLKVDQLHFTAAGWRLIAEEVLRIAGERGLLDGPEPAASPERR
jgi:hypothetical protein